MSPYRVRSQEFAERLRQMPGTWVQDVARVKNTSQRAHYVKTGKWAPGKGFQACVKDGVCMIRWVGP